MQSDAFKTSLVFIARHGQSEDNARDVFQGTRDSPLSDKGREQAQGTGNFLLGKNIGAIFSSPLGRARETAGIISEVIGVPVTVIPSLHEMNFGDFQGQSRTKIHEQFADFFQERSESPDAKLNIPYPGGESYFDVYTRIKSPVTEMLANRGNLVIVGHESVNRMIRGFILNKPLTTMIQDRQKNTDIVEINVLDASEKIHSL